MSAYAIMHDNAATGRSSIVRSIMLKNLDYEIIVISELTQVDYTIRT
jgi:hypothetical protein